MTSACQLAFDLQQESSVILVSTNKINNFLEAVYLCSLKKVLCGLRDASRLNVCAPPFFLYHIPANGKDIC